MYRHIEKDEKKPTDENVEENTPHIVQEVICLKCLCRWIAVRPKYTLLKDLECPHCIFWKGYVIATGQDLEE